MVGSNEAIIEDTYLLAAMITFDPDLSWLPTTTGAETVGFCVSGRIADAMGRYFKGEAAPLQQYSTNLKRLRSSIFAYRHKNGHPNQKAATIHPWR
jgi:hypothetical protein